jgi:hypothetical protein
MSKRGRKSGASLEVVRSIVTVTRPDPFPDLTTDQQNEWVDIVNRLPADWFPRESHALLAQYCRHVVSAKHVSDLIASLIDGDMESSDWLHDYDKLLKMQEREGRAMSSLATRMRITQHSLVSRDKTKGSMKQKPPHLS